MCAQLLLDDELNEHVGEVKDARLKIMLYIRGELGTDRPIAWSVWSRRSSPEQRGTPKLKASNGMFRDLSGLPNKTPGPYSRLFPQASVPVLTEKQNNDAEASRQRLFYMMDSYLHRGLHQGRGTIVHQSQTGSIQYVYLRQVVYRVNDDFYELIAGEVLITEPKVSVDLHPIYGVLFNEERLAAYTDYVARRRAQLCGIEHSTNVPGWTLHGQQQDDVPHKERRRKVPAGFVCAFCGTSETPETRTGPGGRGTLCNRCGIRWAKLTRKAGQPGIDGSDEPSATSASPSSGASVSPPEVVSPPRGLGSP